jgi:hypothetical protein
MLRIERLDQRLLQPRFDFLQRLGGNLLVETLKKRLPLWRSELLQNVGNIRRMHLGEPVLVHLQANTACRVDKVYEVPWDYARTEAACEPVYRPCWKSLEETANGSSETNLDLYDSQRQLGILGMLPVQIHNIDPYHLASMDIDDLLIEQIAFQQDE